MRQYVYLGKNNAGELQYRLKQISNVLEAFYKMKFAAVRNEYKDQ